MDDSFFIAFTDPFLLPFVFQLYSSVHQTSILYRIHGRARPMYSFLALFRLSPQVGLVSLLICDDNLDPCLLCTLVGVPS